MNAYDVVRYLLIIAFSAFTLRMLGHAWRNDPDRKWMWVFTFWITAGFASIYYYFIHKRPKDSERKKFGSG